MEDNVWGPISPLFWDEAKHHFESVPLAINAGEHAHFVFVEDATEIASPGALEMPDGTTILGQHPVFENKPVRFRTCGPEAPLFLEAMDGFETLKSGEISASQREERREQLLVFFKEAQIPLIDIYVSQNDEEYPVFRQTLVPGSWYLVVFRDGETGGTMRPVFYESAELTGEGGVTQAQLRMISPITPPIEVRLREIFSLNHVKDAELSGDEGEGDEGGSGPMPKPLDPEPLLGQGFSHEATWVEVHESDTRDQQNVQQAHQVQHLKLEN